MIRRVVKAALALTLLLAVLLIMIQAFPQTVGADHSLTVLSGSMEPTIGTGSVVFVTEVPPDTIEEGDVITYRDEGGNLVTHRVIEKKEAVTTFRLITKGDANENRDIEPVLTNQIVGVVMFHIPYLGYLVQFSNTSVGWAVLVLVPMVLLFMDGMWQLYLAYEDDQSR